ncbi:MAG TPA: hypothetical protein VN708_01385 [Terriglobales bacterium]|jgi:hypothetical protein|nr:hypothetical protein [Terriglobales bacterium]
MNRIVYQTKETSLGSQVLFRSNSRRAIGAIVLLVLVSSAAFAQYPGGGGAGSSGSYPSYGSKGAVIGAVAGGAAAAGLLYWKFHKRTKVEGCLAGSGDKLVSEKDNHIYNLTNKQNQTLKPGELVELLGKKTKDSSGEPLFEVHKLSKDLGQCTTTTAEQTR